jgi:predicted DCC family thiol-disulfide oxidoreductase YuxK
MAPLNDERRAIVLYDAGCSFCRWSLAKLLAWDRDRRLHPVPLQSTEAKRLLPDLTEGERMASWHLVGPDGGRRSAGAAIGPLLRMLTAGRPLGALAERFPRTTEFAYSLISRHRGTLSRLIPAGARRRADARISQREAAS